MRLVNIYIKRHPARAGCLFMWSKGTDCRGRDAPAAMACFYRGVRCKPVRRGEGTPPMRRWKVRCVRVVGDADPYGCIARSALRIGRDDADIALCVYSEVFTSLSLPWPGRQCRRRRLGRRWGGRHTSGGCPWWKRRRGQAPWTCRSPDRR